MRAFVFSKIAFILAAHSYVGLGIIVPSRNAELLRWCLERGLQIVQQSTLLTTGLCSTPAGSYLPSILFWALRHRAADGEPRS